MKNPKYKYLLLIIDWLILNYAFDIAVKLQTRLKIDMLFVTPPFAAPEVFFFAGYSIIILYIFSINQLYHINVYLTVVKQLQALFKCLFYTILVLVFLSFLTKSRIIIDSRLVIFYFLLISLGLLISVRILIFRTFFKFRFFSLLPLRRVLIVGAEGQGIELASQINKMNQLGLKFVGFLDDKIPLGTEVVNDCKIVGNLSGIPQILNDLEIDEIILCLENIPEEQYLNLIERCAKSRSRVLIATDEFKVIPKYVESEYYGNVPVISVLNSPPYMGWGIIKRITDIIFAVIGLIILSPLFILTALAIKLGSRGPILFNQIRLGKNGIPFTFYKFRSMYLGSDDDRERIEKLRRFIEEGESDSTTSTKIVKECKITRVGKFIRKTSIDELPQLLNVLKGDMSIVGPRPCLPYEWESYSLWHRKRLSITPGCTGIWQVSGRSAVGFRDMAILDMYYIYNVSLHLDLWLILKTIPVMLFGTGAK